MAAVVVVSAAEGKADGVWGRVGENEVESVWEFRWFYLSEKETHSPSWCFGGNRKSFRGNSADFYCDNILTYYSEFKAAAIKNE